MLILSEESIGRPVGFTCSTFDLLHAGHILMLAEAKSICDYLIVGLQNDPSVDRPGVKNKPVQSIVERYVQLKAVKFVDEIIVYNTEKDLEDLLMFLPITIRVLGEEYEGKEFTGKHICEERNIKMFYNSRKHRFSSSELRKRTYESEAQKQNHYRTSVGAGAIGAVGPIGTVDAVGSVYTSSAGMAGANGPSEYSLNTKK